MMLISLDQYQALHENEVDVPHCDLHRSVELPTTRLFLHCQYAQFSMIDHIPQIQATRYLQDYQPLLKDARFTVYEDEERW